MYSGLPSTPGPTTRIVARIPLNKVLKMDHEQRDEQVGSYQDIACPYINRFFWTNSGALIRLINQNIPNLPSEIDHIRIPIRFAENIPKFLYKNQVPLKEWAVDASIKVARACGHNLADDPRITMDEWGIRYTVATLTPEARADCGAHEPGLWILECPEFLQYRTAKIYDDGSLEQFYILKMYISLALSHHRRRPVEGGWNRSPQDDRKEVLAPKVGEKRPRGNPNNSFQQTLINLGAEQERKRIEFEELKKAITQPAPQGPPYPQQFPELPGPTGYTGGQTPWVSGPDKSTPTFII